MFGVFFCGSPNSDLIPGKSSSSSMSIAEREGEGATKVDPSDTFDGVDSLLVRTDMLGGRAKSEWTDDIVLSYPRMSWTDLDVHSNTAAWSADGIPLKVLE